jgi:hypothetical protein
MRVLIAELMSFDLTLSFLEVTSRQESKPENTKPRRKRGFVIYEAQRCYKSEKTRLWAQDQP